MEESIFSDKDFFEIVEEKFENKRKAVEFLISLILSNDDYRIYGEILTNYKEELTPKEIDWITESAKMLFEYELIKDFIVKFCGCEWARKIVCGTVESG